MPDNPFDKVYDQIAELMAKIYANAGKPISYAQEKEALKKINELRQQVEQLKAMSDKFIQGTNTRDYMLQAMLTDTSSTLVTDEERKVLQRGQNLKDEIQFAASDLTKAAEEFLASNKSKVDKKGLSKAKSGKARKLKFRGLGGIKNWKPL